MVLGYFGKTPVEPETEIVNIASEQLGLPINESPILELNDNDPTKGISAAQEQLERAELETTEENIFIVAACGEPGLAFLLGNGTIGIRKKSTINNEQNSHETTGSSPKDLGLYKLLVNGKKYDVSIDGEIANVNGTNYKVELKSKTKLSMAEPQTKNGIVLVKAPIPGKILTVKVTSGQEVKVGEVVVVMEAMKMEMQITAEVDGIVADISISSGMQVVSGQTLLSIN